MMLRDKIPFTFSAEPERVPGPSDRVVNIPATIRTEHELFAALAEGLSFPDYFGYNWDALDECLGDLSWISEGRIVLIHDDLPALAPFALVNYLTALATSALDAPHHGHKVIAVFPPSVMPTILSLLPLPPESRWER